MGNYLFINEKSSNRSVEFGQGSNQFPNNSLSSAFLCSLKPTSFPFYHRMAAEVPGLTPHYQTEGGNFLF